MQKIKVTIEDGNNTVIVEFNEDFMHSNKNSYIHEIGASVSRVVGNMIDNNFPVAPKKNNKPIYL